MAAGALIPILALVTIGIAAATRKKKPAPATGPEAPPMHEIEGADEQMAALYARLMDPTKTNIVELEQGARLLQGNGYPEWAGNIYSKISSLRAAEQIKAQGEAAAKAAAEAAAEAARAAGEAKAEAARKEWEQAYGGRPSDEMLTKTFLAAMDPSLTDIGQLTYAAAVLQAYGKTNEAAQVRARIAKLQAEGTADAGTSVDRTVPGGTAVVLDEGSGPKPATIEPADEDLGTEEPDEEEVEPTAPPPAIAEEETKPPADPIGTIRLARNLIAQEEKSNWKTALQPEVQSWQARAELVTDGKFGPNSAVRMGEEVGILPKIRYWSATGGTKETQLAKYRSRLHALADSLEAKDPKLRAHANALRISASSETGQGYPSAPAKIPDSTKNAELASDVVSTDIDKAELAQLLKLGPEGMADYYARQQAAKETLGVGA